MFRHAILLSLLVALTGCKQYSRSTSGFSSLDKKVLYDFRNQPAPAQATPDPATTRRVLSAVFPAYLTSIRQCKSGPELNIPAQIVPAITSTAEGSFTASGRRQTAYFVDIRACNRSPGGATHRLAVFSAGTLAANAEIAVGNAIVGTYDLDRDGKNELLLQGGGTGQGERIEIAALVAFDKDKLAVLEDFGQIYDDTCKTDLPSKFITASTIYYLPPPAGQKPRFTLELYRAPCPAKGQPPQWTRVTGR